MFQMDTSAITLRGRGSLRCRFSTSVTCVWKVQVFLVDWDSPWSFTDRKVVREESRGKPLPKVTKGQGAPLEPFPRRG